MPQGRPDRFHSVSRIAGLLLAACASATGCATSPSLDVTVHESQRGGVYLEAMSNRYLQAAHPVSLPAGTVSRVLRGVLVQGRQTAVQSIFKSEDKIQHIFSDDDVIFLAPLIVKALSQATPTQQVGFRIVHPPKDPSRILSMSETGGAGVGSSEPVTYGPQFETSTGNLYVYGLSLYLTITEYRKKPSRPDSVNMPNRRLPDSTGMDRVEFLFTPKAALRPESFQQPGLLGEPHLTPIVVDYELLAKLPSPQPRPAQSGDSLQEREPATAIESPHAPESGPKKPDEKGASSEELQTELQAVKEELREIKKQLAEQEAEREKQKKKKKPAQPSP